MFTETREVIFPAWYGQREYQGVNDLEHLIVWIERLKEYQYLACDLETSGLDSRTDRILGMGLSWGPGHGIFIDTEAIGNVAFFHLKPLLLNATLLGYNFKFDMAFLRKMDIEIEKFEDVQILVFMSDPNEGMTGLKDAGQKFLGLETVELKSFFEKKQPIDFTMLSWETKVLYGSADVDLTFAIWEHLAPLKKAQPLVWQMENRLTKVLQNMNERGILINPDEFTRQSKVIQDRIDLLSQEIFDEAGQTFDLDSPKQVNYILFEKLGYKATGKKTKTGQNETGKMAMKMLSSQYPVCGKIAEWKSLAKIKSGFIDKMPTIVNPATGRVHTELIGCNASTGRLSSKNPNLQNVPASLDDAKKQVYDVRRGFVSSPGFVFLDCDYSQIELRVAASMSKEPIWVDAYRKDRDLHLEMATRMYHQPAEKITKQQRQFAKNGNFGLLYGQSAYSFANMYQIPIEEAEKIYGLWWSTVPTLKRWVADEIERGRRRGFATTYFGRQRKMIGIHSQEQKWRKHWERNVISHIIQGGAADVMKLSLINLEKNIKQAELGKDIQMLLSVHDQVLFEVRESRVDEAVRLVRNSMELNIKDWVPLKVDAKIGTTWGSGKKVDR